MVRIAPAASLPRAQIATRAAALVGAPFRLYGRGASAGLDCVGLVGACLAATGGVFDVPRRYRLRGDYDALARSFFAGPRFVQVYDNAWQAGDIILVQIAARQLHFAIITIDGAVHAHMGLGRVVLTPLPMMWATIGHWRFLGV